MKQNKNTLIYLGGIVILAIILAVGLSFFSEDMSGPGQYDDLAKCMSTNGVKFFGAFWCPHCAEEKKMFGNSVKLLPYHECSTPDAAGQTQECIDEKINAYPTWQFADGSRVSQVLKPTQLAALSGCAASLPTGQTADAEGVATSSANVAPAGTSTGITVIRTSTTK